MTNLTSNPSNPHPLQTISFIRLVIAVCLLTFAYPAVANQLNQAKLGFFAQMFCGLDDTGSVQCIMDQFREQSRFLPDSDVKFTQFDTGTYFGCGVTTSAEIECWGDNSNGRINPPRLSLPVVAVTTGVLHGCALDSAGEVHCWGKPEQGRTTVPAGDSPFRLLASSYETSCGIRENNIFECWGFDSAPPVFIDELADVTEFAFSEYVYCGVTNSGSGICWDLTGDILVELNSDFYVSAAATGQQNRDSACFLTSDGAVDCIEDIQPIDPFLTVEEQSVPVRAAGLFDSIDGSFSLICGYTQNGTMECPVGNLQKSGILRVLDVVNQTLELPVIEFTSAEIYGPDALEVFYQLRQASDSTQLTIRPGSRVELFRDGELISSAAGGSSYTDSGIASGKTYSYTARVVHQFGQQGPLSEPIIVDTSMKGGIDSVETAQRFEPANLRHDVYWFDVELLWDRDTTGTVNYYEIRKNGEFVGNTRGVSWYDGATENGKLYVYDVIAFGHDNRMMGFRSEQAQIGAAECSY